MFRHPLIRAWPTKRSSSRIERDAPEAGDRDPTSDPELVDENAALIAEHLEAAGDLHAAYAWHVGAAAWSTIRVSTRHASVGTARQKPTRCPPDADLTAMRIAPRTIMCRTLFAST